MAEPFGTLTPLSETDRVVADPDEDVRSRSVIDSAGEKVGTVADLLVDTVAGHVRFLRVEHGGILGFGASSSFVPVEAIHRVTEDEVHVGTSKDHVAGGPRYDPELVEQQQHFEQVYGHYGHPPYWAPTGPVDSGLPTAPGLPPVR